MEELISRMEEFQNLHSIIKSWCIEISIEQPKIMSYSLERVSKLYDNYLEKYGSKKNILCQKQNQFEPVWFENELILFQWAVISYSLCHQISIKDFAKTQIEFFSSIFRHKESYIVDYEIKCMIVKGKQIRNGWKVDEQKLLSSIIKSMPEKNKWNQIARQLYKVSGGVYFRQGKHCRQRWFSYMQNHTAKQDWSIESDVELLQLVSAIGKNWSQVANNFTSPQNTSFLKKRFKILTEEVKAKFGHSISDKQVLELLLKEKYLQLSEGKEQCLLKNKKISPLKRKSSRIIFSIEENIRKQDSLEDQSNSFSEGQNHKSNSQEKVQIQANFQEISEKREDFAQGRHQNNWIGFPNSTHNFSGTICEQYIPLQFYSHSSSIFNQNFVQGFNWLAIHTPYQPEGCYFFY